MIFVVMMDISTFIGGVLSSVIGALIVLFVLFYFFRPRIKIYNEIAIDEDGKLVFCFRNKSIAPCINVKVAVKVVEEEENANETEYIIELEDATYPYMSGRWSKKKDLELGVVTMKAKEEYSSHLRIFISAQHAISGIVSVTTRDFNTDNARKGDFVKGRFVPKESD